MALVLLLMGGGLFLVMLLGGRKKYTTTIQSLNATDYPLRNLLPVGFLLMDSLGYTYQTAYDKRLLSRLNELYGTKQGRGYLRVHWANQVTLFYLLILMVLLFWVGLGPDASTDMLVLGAVLPLAAVYFLNQEVVQRVKKRKDSIQIDFTEFLNKLILLLNAGMPLRRAWKKIVEESHRETCFYQEIKATLQAIEGGIAEAEAYEAFANRCRVPEIYKFVTLILQGMKKGSGEMVRILWLLSNECWMLRKNRARQIGEEASTKLLFPMIMMLLAILIVVATPAILVFRGF